MMEQTCQGCAHWPDFPGHIKCQGCARVYSDHYEDANQNKIVKLRVVFTQYVMQNGKWHALSGGYYDTEFICNDCRLQNLHQLEFPIAESDVATVLQLEIKNPSNNMTLCSSRKTFTPHIVSVYMKERCWSISYNPSMEYIQDTISANTVKNQSVKRKSSCNKSKKAHLE